MKTPLPSITDNKIKYYIDHTTIVEDNIYVIIGWCVFNSNLLKEIKVEYENGSTIKELSICYGNRADVLSHFKLNTDNINSGFVIIFKKAKDIISNKFKIVFQNDFGLIDSSLVIEKKEKIADVINKINHFTEAQIKNVSLTIHSKQDNYTILETKNDVISLDQSKIRFAIDDAILLNSGIFVSGWLDDLTIDIKGIYISNSGKLSQNKINIISRRYRHDVNSVFPEIPITYKIGFYGFFPIPEREKNLDYNIIFELNDNKIVKVPFKSKIYDNEVRATEIVLSNFNPFKDDILSIFENNISYVLKEIWKNKKELNLDKLYIKQFGKLNNKPKCSIIVPIYGRIDFIMYQLSQFADDKDFEESELIYVLDDPRLEPIFFEYCNTMSKIYKVPFKCVYNSKNNGFGGANNIGVHIANGKKVILLNSDVMPSENGWISKMSLIYDKLDKPGALGIKLVYEDESIQHLGMNFYMHEVFKIYMNEHPGKGLPVNFNPTIDTKQVNAVTAACVMIDKELFNSFGGFDLDYILGDFEDSDMCLKLISLGYKNYLASQVKMYHLERQSQNLVDQGDWKFKITLYNGWQQYKKWKSLIEKLLNIEN